MMTASRAALDLIRRHEGCRLTAYLCPAGKPTIGYGHTLGVRMGQRITAEQAEEFLRGDVRPAERLLNSLSVPLSQRQFDALVSWIFNLGTGRFVGSTLCKRLQAGDSDNAVAAEIVKWVYAGCRRLPGLMARRVDEANLFLGHERYRVVNNQIVSV